MTKPLDRMTWINWMEPTAVDCVRWLETQAGNYRPEIIEAYRAGIKEGMRQALKLMQLHSHIEMKD